MSGRIWLVLLPVAVAGFVMLCSLCRCARREPQAGEAEEGKREDGKTGEPPQLCDFPGCLRRADWFGCRAACPEHQILIDLSIESMTELDARDELSMARVAMARAQAEIL